MRIFLFFLLLSSTLAFGQKGFLYRSDFNKCTIRFRCPFSENTHNGLVTSVYAKRCGGYSQVETIAITPKDSNVKFLDASRDYILELTKRPEFVKFVYMKRRNSRISFRFLEKNGITQEGVFLIGEKHVYVLICASLTKDFNPKLAQEFIQSFKELK